MNRRHFLRSSAFFTVVAAAGPLAACSGESSTGPANAPAADPDATNMPAAGPTATNTPDAGPDKTPPLAKGLFQFPQGVASGDPRSDSIVFWTRAVAASGVTLPVALQLQVSSNADFSTLDAQVPLQALADFDFTVRAKVTKLNPATTYYYRFVAGSEISATGTAKTAPAAGSATPQIRFAWITCQDWTVNHWQALTEVVKEGDLDFVVHLGDYIYEAIGAGYQAGGAEPAHTPFTLPDSVALPEGGTGATSLADYRTLYRTYRTDARLQALHQRFAMISIWDDHEFSNDCWQDHQAYTNANDQQTARRLAASQAWAEYMPIDWSDVQLESSSTDYAKIKIYRSFSYGDLMDLVMTDERLFRDQHVMTKLRFMDQTQLQAAIQNNFDTVMPAVAHALPAAIPALSASLKSYLPRNVGSDSSGKTGIKKTGIKDIGSAIKNSVVNYANGKVGAVVDAVVDAIVQTFVNFLAKPDVASPISKVLNAHSPSAVEYVSKLTASMLSEQLANLPNAASTNCAQLRYAVPTPFLQLAELICGAPSMLGEAQLQWFKDTMRSSTAKWKVWGNEVILTSLTFDMSAYPDLLAKYGQLGSQFLLNCDGWDGYPTERADIAAYLQSQGIQNVVAITGDIHAFFAGNVSAGKNEALVEFVTAGISSNSFFAMAYKVASFREMLRLTTAEDFARRLQNANPSMVYGDPNAQGYATATVTPDAFSVVLVKVKPLNDDGTAPEDAVESRTAMSVKSGANRIELEAPGN